MSNGPMNGRERTRFVLSNVTLTGNVGATCGAVAMSSYLAATLDALEVTATGNRARTGDAGALCVVPLVSRVTGTLGQTVALSDHAGDISLVPPGSPAPLGAAFTAGWVLTPFPGCLLSLVITAFMPVVAFQATFLVQDVATGAPLVQNLGSPTIGALPLEVLSTTDAGLNISYAWAPISATANREAGFLASWRNSCPAAGGGGGARVLSDATRVSIAGGAFTGGVAAQSGGALVIAADAGFAGTRSAALQLESVDFVDNVARAGDGGGIVVRKNVPLNMSECRLRFNRALNGQGGAIAILSDPSASVTSSDFSFNSAGGDGGHGGGLAVSGAGLTLHHVDFLSNTAQARRDRHRSRHSRSSRCCCGSFLLRVTCCYAG